MKSLKGTGLNIRLHKRVIKEKGEENNLTEVEPVNY